MGTDTGILFKMARVVKTAAGAEAPFSGYQPELYLLARDINQVSQPSLSRAHLQLCSALCLVLSRRSGMHLAQTSAMCHALGPAPFAILLMLLPPGPAAATRTSHGHILVTRTSHKRCHPSVFKRMSWCWAAVRLAVSAPQGRKLRPCTCRMILSLGLLCPTGVE